MELVEQTTDWDINCTGWVVEINSLLGHVSLYEGGRFAMMGKCGEVNLKK
jgi:hypothetical protein